MSTTTTIQEAAEATNESFTVEDLVDFSGRQYGDWRDEFHKNGCVVLKNVISPERAKYYCDKQIEWLKKFELGFDEHDESTWTAEHLPVSFKGGFVLLLHPTTRLGRYRQCPRGLIWKNAACTLPTAPPTKKWPGKHAPSRQLSRSSRNCGKPKSYFAPLTG
jgi:hypothetical protein